ncbi:hypothetical protein QQF64_018276, partial [Cirrhinus molitorella]
MNDPEPCPIKQEDVEQQIDLKQENRETEEQFEAEKKHQRHSTGNSGIPEKRTR